MKWTITTLSTALIVLAGPSVAAADRAHLESTIAFTSSRDQPTLLPAVNAAEIYLATPDVPADPTMPPQLTNLRRLTSNQDEDVLASLSPDGKTIVFDSNRNRGDGSLFTSDLFVMNPDGTEQTLLTRGSSATWSPNSKRIAFHASASGTGTPIRTNPGSATTDSDIFVAKRHGLLTGNKTPTNITNTPGKIEDDPDWSPDGHSILYTAHDVGDEGPNYPALPFNSSSAEIYERDAHGTGEPTQLTHNGYEERGASWSPDGARIVFGCRIGSLANAVITDFEICVMNADGTNLQQLTDNTVQDMTPTFSPDGQQIVFHRTPPNQMFMMRSTLNPDGSKPTATQLTSEGLNILANWGALER
jgi:TolB protein